jgi:monoamine oxidase
VSASLRRRAFLAAGASSLTAACSRQADAPWSGGWVGDAAALGHRVRDAAPLPQPTTERRVALVIVGGGIAGLAAARAAQREGIDDIVLLDLHDAAGGNSRGHVLGGVPCPLGAHYLPTPGPHAHEVSEWLHEIGVARHAHGRTVYDERHLCHSPQERLFFEGAWHEGLVPPADPSSSRAAQYRRFALLVREAQADAGFAMPTRRVPWSAAQAALDAQTFAQWLDAHALDDTALRWYLDYCCRDDYGAASNTVSAWAGLHYFASRHGFHAEGDDDAAGSERDAVLTWPQGNAWLVQRLAAGLGHRWRGRVGVRRVAVERDRVVVDAWDDGAQQMLRWSASRVVMAAPLFIAARIVESPPNALREAAAALRYAPWLVANLQLRTPLVERPIGTPLAWDNVVYGSRGLGYVAAQHQHLEGHSAAHVLTSYHALPISERSTLLDAPWQHWAERVVDDLQATHPDLRSKLQHIDLARHGHAMAIPAPGVRGHAALAALAAPSRSERLHWAHADLAGYSVFEEAFTAGDAAGRAAARALHRR